jgi:hypothetical protein
MKPALFSIRSTKRSIEKELNIFDYFPFEGREHSRQRK